MIVKPRYAWTSQVPSPTIGADIQEGLRYNRKPVGITLITPPVIQDTYGMDPQLLWNAFMKESHSVGRSDIDFNLGVTNNADAIWNLRGLQNVSSATPSHTYNTEFLSIYLSIGTEEKPTDHLLRNVLDARRLVLSRYPTAAQVDWQGCCNPYLQAIFSKNPFWEGAALQALGNSPVGNFSLPDMQLHPGQTGVQVFDLQEQLAYWRYYRTRCDGIYNAQTIDAVIELQADLLEGKLYYYGTDGIYSDHLRRAWLKYLN